MRSSLAAVMVFSVGCVQSLQPIVDHNSQFRDDALIGTWSNGTAVLQIMQTPDHPSMYMVTHTQEDKSIDLWLNVAKYGDHTYWQIEHPDTNQTMRVTMFQFGHYSLKDNKLTISPPDRHKWLSALHSEDVAYVARNGYVILTAPTRQIARVLSATGDRLFVLQTDVPDVLRRDIATGELFDDPGVFMRVDPPKASD